MPLWKQDRYSQIAAMLPVMLRDADALVEADLSARQVRGRLLHLVGWLMTQTRQFGEAEFALSRAMDDMNDPLDAAATISTHCWLLLRQGWLDEARQMATQWADDVEPRMAVVVPDDHWDNYLEARACQIRINSRQGRLDEEFDLSYLLDRLRVQRDGSRVGALRDGDVTLFKDSRAREDEILRRSKAIQWVQIDITLGERKFYLLNGEWHEIGPTYLASVRAAVERLIVAPLSTDLPAWDLAHNEHRFCEDVVEHRPGWVCMDGNLVKTRLHRGRGVEVCDLLLPDDTLLMAKHARKDAGPLSHLFKQALVAVQSLQHDPEAVAEFREKVTKAPSGRVLPADFRPTKVILAILLKDGKELTVDTLFPFAQVALVHTATTLRSWGVTVEVVGIRGKACVCELKDTEAA
ncbi:TIGR04141 family sporadically distributed protein [Microbispora amethystogenes]|uniref:TIGR04141 family sporadically distributed protein n=1 Tax=Microbispora amethystogenes TaxID=1427754 RepID=UPI0033E37485